MKKVLILTNGRVILALGILLSLLVGLDWIISAQKLPGEGLVAEKNFLLRHAMAYYGILPTLALTKVLSIAVIMAASFGYRNDLRRAIPVAFSFLCCIYAVIVVGAIVS